MTKWILGAVMALAMLAPSAGAETLLVRADGYPHPLQSWVKEMKVPSPPLTLTVLSSDCPWYEGDGIACTHRGDYTIWFPEGDRETLYHEVGHNVDYYVAPEWIRYRFRVLTRDWREWTTDPNGPNENFASAYARCAILGTQIARDPNIALGPNLSLMTKERFARVCRLLDRLPG